MRKTKVLQILSLAASVATPTLAFAASPHNTFNLNADGVNVLKDANAGPGAIQELGAATTLGGHVTQVNNHPYYVLLGDGSWGVNSNWSTGAFPNAPSDSAEFFTLAIQNAGANVSLDGAYTVGTIGFHSEFQHNVIPPTTLAQQTLTITTGQVTSDDAPNGNFNTIVLGNAIRTNIAGTNGLTKLGTGPLQLSAASTQPGNVIASTYSGGTGVNINAGMLSISDDGSLGDLSNNVTMQNNTTLLVSGTTTAGISTFRNFALNGRDSFILFNDTTFAGQFSGSGDLVKSRNTANSMILANSNNYTGATIIGDAGGMQLNDSGAITNSSRIDIGGVLSLNVTGSSSTRIGNTIPINMYGGALNQLGKTGTGPIETLGNLSLNAGLNRIYVNDTTTANTKGSLKFGTITRNNNATLFVRGNGLGAGAAAAAAGSITFTTAPTMIGGGGAPGTTTISTIPWISGNNSPTAAGDQNGVVTYDAVAGLRPLSGSEYATTFGVNAADNVRLIAPTLGVNAPQTMNSLVLSGTGSVGGGVQGTGQLTITSGQIVFSDLSTDANGALITNPVSSPNEIVLHGTASAGEIDGLISNGASGKGLTGAAGTMFITNTGNTYTGPTQVNHSFLVTTGNLPNNAPSALGVSSTPIFIRPGGNSDVLASNSGTSGSTVAGLLVTNAVAATGAVVDRAIQIDTDPSVFTTSGTSDVGTNNADGAGAVVFNGAIAVNGAGIMRLNGQAPTAAASGANDPTKSGMIFNGVISGTGRVNDLAYAASATQNPLVNRFNAQNTFSGSTTMIASTFQLGSSSVVSGGNLVSGPLGTGTINVTQVQLTATTFSTNPSIQAMDAPRTLANNMRYRTTPNFIGSQPITLTGFQDMGSGLRAVNVTNTADTTISGVIGRGGLVKQGVGRLILTGNNVYSGQSQVTDQGGVLAIGSNNALGGSTQAFATSVGGTFLLGNGVVEVFNNITSPETFFLGASGSPTTVVATGNIRNTTGNNTLSGFIGLGSTANIGVNAGGTLSQTGTLISNTSTASNVLSKVGAGQLNVRALNLISTSTGLPTGTLSVSVGAGTLHVNANGTATNVGRVNTLSIGASGFVDQTNNDLIVSGTPKSTVVSYVAAGYNFGGFDGVGGMSTSSGLTGAGNTALGVLDANEYANNNGSPTFDGVTVGANDVLVKYTYFGDVDFNGAVDSTDYNIIDFGFLTGASGWANGDVDYNGAVDSTDYNSIDFAFVTQSGALRRAISYLDGTDRSTKGMGDPSLQEVVKHYDEFGNVYAAGFLAHVPEPTSLGVVGLAAGALMGRRRRRVSK